MIRVALVEDQTLVRQGLRSMLDLAGDMQVIGEAEDGVQATERLPELRPDVVLLDLRMPHLDGLGVLQRLSAHGTLPPTLVLTTFDDDELILECVQAGARGYLLKDVALPQLLQAIRTVAGGGRWLQPAVTQRVLRGLEAFRPAAEPFTPCDAVTLTDRECDVLRLLAGGYSNREIAGALRTTEGTVKSYVSNVLSKLGVRDRTRAVLKALELGVL
ncbi:response regulator [Deinococcus maricopensis]|uniref:Two component transcriptional regulator, LuxR family n=1 Tax=Deinococcus maricopensis (strain DSM 21211 / LMG 22137 / NRRL B-23946 / LB-34) TaxID=709986 RepID=E8U754_DEIML|nr:response regulator transcription factor [Deinococcus maricopensis]ADV66893.1 two component transcriptional regulator, LuxR family [Deinococcus maricopensis DSM 21211]